LAPSAIAGVAMLGLSALGAAWTVHRGLPVAVEPATLAWATAVGALTSGTLAWPAAVITGAMVTTQRWALDGSLRAIGASGLRGRGLLGPAVVWGALGALVTFAWGWSFEPGLRRGVREELARATVEARWNVGARLRVGPDADATVIAEDEVLVSGAGFVGVARRSESGARVFSLVDGEWVGQGSPPWRLRFRRWVPGPPPSRRIELDERTVPEVAEVVRRRESRGEDAAYERCVYAKRWLHPLSALFGAVGAVPWAARFPSLRVGAAFLLVYWLAVRVGDVASASLGPWLAAGLGPASLAVTAAWGWWTWRDA
jgi:lipopolysaccharide export LptBFGC system permease protein LptF